MKSFRCGDVVPGCKRVFQMETEEEILTAAASHARADHHLTQIPPELLMHVRSLIRDVVIA